MVGNKVWLPLKIKGFSFDKPPAKRTIATLKTKDAFPLSILMSYIKRNSLISVVRDHSKIIITQ